MKNQKGIIHPPLLIVLAAVVVVWAVVIYLVVNQLGGKLPIFAPKEPTVELKTQYQNPFKKASQYVNPFDQYKSPFQNLR